MALQTGLIKLQGRLDNIVFYQTKYGFLVRMKTSLNAKRIATDPAYVRTRENNMEFGMASKAGKLFRQTLNPLLIKISDSGVVSKIMKLMIAIKDYDVSSDRGQRTVAAGIHNPQAKKLLSGFFSGQKPSGISENHLFVVPASGEVHIMHLIPASDIHFPAGATHISFQSGWARVDFSSGTGSIRLSSEQFILIDGTSQNISPGMATTPEMNLTGTDIYLLCVRFCQEINGIIYPLKDETYNSLSIVKVQ